jgi:hypothetical protein
VGQLLSVVAYSVWHGRCALNHNVNVEGNDMRTWVKRMYWVKTTEGNVKCENLEEALTVAWLKGGKVLVVVKR